MILTISSNIFSSSLATKIADDETFLAEAHFAPGALGNRTEHAEVDFYIVPGAVSMNLSAMAVCTKHGLWQSEPKEVKIIRD